MHEILFKITGRWSGSIMEGSFTAECERKGELLPTVQMLLAAMEQDKEIALIIQTAAMAHTMDLSPLSFTTFKRGYNG